MKKILFSLLMISLMTGCASNNKLNEIEKNKKLVTDFYKEVLFESKYQSIDKYIGDVYIQHNPMVGDGKQAFTDMVKSFAPKDGKVEPWGEIVRVVAEGDLVVLHIKSYGWSGENGGAGVDIFGVKDGKIVEHWDVLQAIPDNPANDNTMF